MCHTVLEFVLMRLLQMSTCYCSTAHHPHCSNQQPQQPQQQQQVVSVHAVGNMWDLGI